MKSWFGSYISTFQAEPLEATVLATEDHITIGYRREDGTTQTVRWDLKDIFAVFDRSQQATKITAAGEKDCGLLVNGKEATDFILQMQAEQQKPWYKKDKTKESLRNLYIFFAVAGILVATYFLLVPWVSEKLVSNVSIETEERFGNAVFDALDLSQQRDQQSTLLLNDFFKEMKIPTEYNVRITAVNGDEINAFALPGGHIIVYNALLKELKTYPELAALLSHEFTHINNRHSTRSIFRQLGSGIFLSLLFGRFGNVTTVLADQADKFKSLEVFKKFGKRSRHRGSFIAEGKENRSRRFCSVVSTFESISSGIGNAGIFRKPSRYR